MIDPNTDLPAVLFALGITEGYRDTSSYEKLIATAVDPAAMPSEETVVATWNTLKAKRLQDARAAAMKRVDDAAGQARLRFITDVPGQAETYIAKQKEVERWRAAGSPAEVGVGEGYTWAERRAARRGVTVGDVLAEWAARIDDWTLAGQAIEDIREQAKEDIAAAASTAEIAAVLSGLSWPSP